MRTQVKNQLQALALNQGVQRKWKLWSEAAGVAAAAALGEPAQSGVAATARSTGGVDQRVGPCGGRAGFGAAGGTAIDDASRRGTGHGTRLHADDGAG